jgi:hypothetical protein
VQNIRGGAKYHDYITINSSSINKTIHLIIYREQRIYKYVPVEVPVIIYEYEERAFLSGFGESI